MGGRCLGPLHARGEIAQEGFAAARPSIPGGATLIFDIELLVIVGGEQLASSYLVDVRGTPPTLARFPQAVALQNNRLCALVRSTNHSVHPGPAQRFTSAGCSVATSEAICAATTAINASAESVRHRSTT